MLIDIGGNRVLDIFKKKTPKNSNKLFRMTLQIGRGANTDMPSHLVGAYVPVFVASQNHEAAATRAVTKIREQGFEFLDIADQKIDELDPKKWAAFVKEAWPEFEAHFPTQQAVISELAQDFLFIGPFAGYESSTDA